MNGPTERERELEAKVERLREQIDAECLPDGQWSKMCDSFADQRDAALARVAVLEQQIAALEAELTQLAARCPEDDWPSSGDMSEAAIADTARYLLGVLAAGVVDNPTDPGSPS